MWCGHRRALLIAVHADRGIWLRLRNTARTDVAQVRRPRRQHTATTFVGQRLETSVATGRRDVDDAHSIVRGRCFEALTASGSDADHTRQLEWHDKTRLVDRPRDWRTVARTTSVLGRVAQVV